MIAARMLHPRRLSLLSGLMALLATALEAQAPSPPTPEERARLDELTREDHADMLRKLGITKLRPGPSGRAAAGEPNAANYDAARANPHPDWPEVLKTKDGRPVADASTWWKVRRPEIVEDFEREVYGRVPEDVPRLSWAVTETVETLVGGQPVVARR